MESKDRQLDSIELNTFKTACAWCTTPTTLESWTVLGLGRQPLSPWNLEWRLGKIKIKQKQLNHSKVETDVVMMDIMGILMVWFKINSLYSLIIEDLLQFLSEQAAWDKNGPIFGGQDWTGQIIPERNRWRLCVGQYISTFWKLLERSFT